MVIPYVEAGCLGTIPLAHVERALLLEIEALPSCDLLRGLSDDQIAEGLKEIQDDD